MTATTSTKDMTMAELLAKRGHSVASFTKGQRVESTVVSISDTAVLLDIGGKSEGIVKEKGYQDAKELITTLKVGDTVLATILVPESRDGTIVMALRDAMHDKVWERLEEAIKSGEEVAVMGKGVNPSGFAIDVEGLSGFIPMSQLGKEIAGNPQKLVGKYFKAKVMEVDKRERKVVLSEKEISEAGDIANAKKAMKDVKEGDVYDGVVTTVANFGCFVKFSPKGGSGSAREVKKKGNPVYLEGLVHVSELAFSRVANPHDFVKSGDSVKVKVLAARDGKLALSMKQAGKDPWTTVTERFKVEDKIKGKIVRISDFGMFVEMEPGVEGLVHITKMPPTEKFEIGKEVTCIVEEIDSKNRKIALGLVLTSVPVGYK